MKKRLVSFTVIFLLCFSFFTPHIAIAEEKYDITVDSYGEFYDALKSGMSAFQGKISIRINNYDEDVFNFTSTVDEIVNRHPEINYNHGGASVSMRSYYSYQTYRVFDIYFRYRGSQQELDNLIEIKDYIQFKNLIVESLKSFDNRMLFKVYNYDDKIHNLDNAINTILSEVPDLDYGIDGWSTTIYGEGKDRLLEVNMNYSYSKEKMIEMKEAVDKKAKEIISNVINPNMNDFEKELALHDYVLNNAYYNTDFGVNKTLPEDEHTAYGVLIKGKGVCSSYAKAMHKLLDMVGIESYFVTGTGGGEPHAWNIVKIQDSYYHLDATWNDTIANGKDELSHDYFNLADNQISYDHTWNNVDYPVCSSTLFSYENIQKIISGEISFTAPEDSVGNKTVYDLPNNTVVIGNRAFDIEFANNPDNVEIIYNVLFQGIDTEIYVKLNDKWFDIDGADVRVEDIPDISYTSDGFNYMKFKSINNGQSYQDEKDKILTSLTSPIVGSRIGIDIEINGLMKDYPTVEKFSLVGTETIANLGEELFIFPAKKVGDVIQVQLYTTDDKIVNTINVTISEEIQAPRNLSASAISDSIIELKWDKVEDADYYHVYESDSFDGPYRPYIDESGNMAKYYWYSDYCLRVYSILPNTTVYFKVVAVKNGIESDFSNIISATTFSSSAQRAMKIVHEGSFYQYPNTTVKDAFDSYFIDPEWEYFESTNDNHVIEFKGKCYFNNELVEILVQFTVDVDNETFVVKYREKSGEIMSDDVFLDLLKSVYSQ